MVSCIGLLRVEDRVGVVSCIGLLRVEDMSRRGVMYRFTQGRVNI